jgi:hypothetical protein
MNKYRSIDILNDNKAYDLTERKNEFNHHNSNFSIHVISDKLV